MPRGDGHIKTERRQCQATPDTWRDEFVVNAGNTAGAQFEPDIVQLANGNILVAWTDAANNVDSAPGADIIGQIFDPLGNAVGGPIHLNAAGRFFDDEGEFELAALPNGGFVMAYEDTDAGGTSIITGEYNAAGVSTAVRVITADPGADDLGDPSVSVNANGTYIVSYQQAGAGGTSTYGKLVNPAAGTVGVQQTYVSGADDMALIQNVSMARLGNGNHVVVSQYDNDPDGAIAYRLIDPSGAGIGATRYVAGTDANDGGDSDADVAALTGGGFVVVWTNTDVFDTDILFQRYDNAGTAQGGPVTVDGGAITDENNEASITALSDGGFVIVWDDDEANVIAGQRYSASGVALGSVFTVGGAGSAPQGTSLADGRFAVTWSQGGDIRMEIFDTRTI